MGCALSKPTEGDDDAVSICRDRKRLIKSAVKRRYALGDAFCKYNQSLYSVAMALRLFAARHSSPPSPFLITFPQSSNSVAGAQVFNPLYLQRGPSESKTQEAIACEPPTGTISSHSSHLEREEEEDDDSEEEREICEHFYGDEFPTMPPTHNGFGGWDFFNPFDGMRTEVVNGLGQSSDADLRAVREAEGIPDLEEVGERDIGREGKRVVVDDGGGEVSTVADANESKGEHKSLEVIGRELLEALKDVEDHFVRAYESGLDVSKKLETNLVHLQSGLEEIKDNPNKIVQSITGRRSTSSRSSSSKSFLASSSWSSSTWTDFKNDSFDECRGMNSGSHSLTLGRLYAWEKKLYEEVKAGDHIRKMYEQKCMQLRNQDARGKGLHIVDKTRSEVRDLYSRISVAMHRVESISQRIQKLRDEELQPQLVELLHCLMTTWKIMLVSHESQKQAMSEVKIFTCPAYGKFRNDSHRLATLQLEAELWNWRACFVAFVSAQKAYAEALDGWLSKFIAPEVEFYSRGRSSVLPSQINGPPLIVICRGWLTSLEKLPDKLVTYAMKSFGKDIQALWAQQGVEQQQKRKVDGLAKELDKKAHSIQRAEGKILRSKLSGHKTDVDVRNRVEYVEERKNLLDSFRNRLDAEKAKHCDCMQETQRITLHGFQAGFSSVFKSLREFSKASSEMYADLVANGEQVKVGIEQNEPPSLSGTGSQILFQ